MSQRVLVVAPAGAGITALCDGLRSARPDWQVLMATSRASALAVCGALSLDALVVDTALGADAPLLLESVAGQFPAVGRVALGAGTDSPAAVAGASGVGESGIGESGIGESGVRLPVVAVPDGSSPVVATAHRVLPRTPPSFPLALAVQASTSAAQQADVDPVSKLIADVEDLPSSPATWTRLRTLLADPDVDIRVLAETISRDVGTTARVLRLVNSSFLGLRRRITDVREAITVLGLRTISSVVLSAEVMAAFGKLRAVPGLNVDALSCHGLASGVVARSLLPDRAQADDGFVAGLLQDAGQLALATAAPDAFRHCLAEAAWRNAALHEVEREILGCDHAQAGAALLVLWQMPEPVVAAVAGSHTPLPDPLPFPLDTASTVRLAHCLTTTRWSNWRDPGERGDLTPLAEEGDRVLFAADMEDRIDEVGLLLAGELSGTAAALQV